MIKTNNVLDHLKIHSEKSIPHLVADLVCSFDRPHRSVLVYQKYEELPVEMETAIFLADRIADEVKHFESRAVRISDQCGFAGGVRLDECHEQSVQVFDSSAHIDDLDLLKQFSIVLVPDGLGEFWSEDQQQRMGELMDRLGTSQLYLLDGDAEFGSWILGYVQKQSSVLASSQ